MASMDSSYNLAKPIAWAIVTGLNISPLALISSLSVDTPILMTYASPMMRRMSGTYLRAVTWNGWIKQTKNPKNNQNRAVQNPEAYGLKNLLHRAVLCFAPCGISPPPCGTDVPSTGFPGLPRSSELWWYSTEMMIFGNDGSRWRTSLTHRSLINIVVALRIERGSTSVQKGVTKLISEFWKTREFKERKSRVKNSEEEDKRTSSSRYYPLVFQKVQIRSPPKAAYFSSVRSISRYRDARVSKPQNLLREGPLWARG